MVRLAIRGPAGATREIDAVVDAGYSGFLTIPEALAIELKLPFAYVGRAFLANDDEVRFDVTTSPFCLWDGQPRDIRADATGSTPLIGMLLLDGHDLSVQARNGGRVVIRA